MDYCAVSLVTKAEHGEKEVEETSTSAQKGQTECELEVSGHINETFTCYI